jgi:uncharacterized protein YecE (DUF72 family)
VKPRVGCAGWSIPSAHGGLFGPGESVLARYATRFRAVEINSSFYRPHQPKTYQRWAAAVPDDFLFSVKVPGDITHEQRLQRSGALLDRFVDETAGLGGKLAGVLVQLPPSLPFDARVADTFFAMLRRRLSAGIACEPRHASWFTTAAEKVWARYRVARVAADPAICAQAGVPGGDPGWSYWRWHGSPRMYYSEYSPDTLRRLAEQVRSTPPSAALPWIVFDNTAWGHATANAAQLQSLLEADASAARLLPAQRKRK